MKKIHKMEPNQNTIQRSQLAYPLDAESLGILKTALPTPLKELARVQAITLLTGNTTFDVRNTDVMSVTGNAAVTIATITNGYSGQILTLLFNDANVTITDTGTGASGTVNLSAAFVSSANNTLQLVSDGTSWREVGRGSGFGDALTTNPLSQFAATTSAQLAGVISDETGGNGVLVFNNSPSITSPKLNQILDSASNELITFTEVTSAINQFNIQNQSIGNNPVLTAEGGDTNIGIAFQVKGTGTYVFNGTTAQQAQIALMEDTDNGSNVVFLTVAASIASNVTLTLPSATDTLVGRDTTDTLTNKTLTTPIVTTNITTGSTTFALLNTTATTINFAGAATTLNIGASATCILNFGGSTTASEFRFLEPSGSGTNYSAFKAVAQSANITYSLPPTVGAAGTFLKDAAGDGVLTWATAGGWNTVAETQVLTNGTQTTFTDIDCSGTVGANVALIILKATISGDAASQIYIRRNGDTGAYTTGYTAGTLNGAGTLASATTVTTTGILVVPCDSSGIIEYAVNGTNAIGNLYILGYIK